MKRAYATYAVTAIAALGFSSCATIFSGTKHTFVLNTKPEDAKVTVTNKKGKEIFSGQTPAQVRLKSGAGYFSPARYVITFSKPGFVDQTVPVSFKISGWYFGNILIGGALGMLIIDPLTGGMWTVGESAKNIFRPLRPQGVALEVIDINDLNEEQRRHLIKVN